MRGKGEILNKFIAGTIVLLFSGIGVSKFIYFLPESFLVHILSCGRHLAAVLRSSRLIIICDFNVLQRRTYRSTT
jgi:hypothetical protein